MGFGTVLSIFINEVCDNEVLAGDVSTLHSLSRHGTPSHQSCLRASRPCCIKFLSVPRTQNETRDQLLTRPRRTFQMFMWNSVTGWIRRRNNLPCSLISDECCALLPRSQQRFPHPFLMNFGYGRKQCSASHLFPHSISVYPSILRMETIFSYEASFYLQTAGHCIAEDNSTLRDYTV